MEALLPILYVMLVDICWACLIYGIRTSGKVISKTKKDNLVKKLSIYVSFHLVIIVGIYCLSQTGNCNWYNHLSQGKDGSIVFYLLNFLIYTFMMFLYDLIYPVANYKLAFNTAVGIFVVSLLLSFIFSFFTSPSKDEGRGNLESLMAGYGTTLDIGVTDSLPIYGCVKKIMLNGEIEARNGKNGTPFTVKSGGNADIKCGSYMLYVTNKDSVPVTVEIEPKLECKRYRLLANR